MSARANHGARVTRILSAIPGSEREDTLISLVRRGTVTDTASINDAVQVLARRGRGIDLHEAAKIAKKAGLRNESAALTARAIARLAEEGNHAYAFDLAIKSENLDMASRVALEMKANGGTYIAVVELADKLKNKTVADRFLELALNHYLAKESSVWLTYEDQQARISVARRLGDVASEIELFMKFDRLEMALLTAQKSGRKDQVRMACQKLIEWHLAFEDEGSMYIDGALGVARSSLGEEGTEMVLRTLERYGGMELINAANIVMGNYVQGKVNPWRGTPSLRGMLNSKKYEALSPKDKERVKGLLEKAIPYFIKAGRFANAAIVASFIGQEGRAEDLKGLQRPKTRSMSS